MNNVMFALETLDPARTGVLLSMGACFFDMSRQKIGEKFYVEISKDGIKNQIEKGRTLSIDTLTWWMQQSDDARKVFWPATGRKKSYITGALTSFQDFCQRSTGPVALWGYDTHFDNIFLRDVYASYGLRTPWHSCGDRCYQTIASMFKGGAPREGKCHNGLDDAVAQAEHLMKIVRGKEISYD